jgi:hypothetical protein
MFPISSTQIKIKGEKVFILRIGNYYAWYWDYKDQRYGSFVNESKENDEIALVMKEQALKTIKEIKSNGGRK